ncbi:MAG TPA: hypothetical protein P5317_07575 [Myxococcota bacterium]|jgi:hypothetical protein|nr:hypothetical protein [Myxococcota bacterium]
MTTLADFVALETQNASNADAATQQVQTQQTTDQQTTGSPQQDQTPVGQEPAGQMQTGQEPAGQEPTGTEPTTGEPCQTCSKELMQYVKEEFGVDFSDKYSDDSALLKGLIEAQKMIGKRDEASQLVGALVQRYGQEGLMQLLQGAPPQQQTQEPQTAPPQEQLEWDPTWLKLVHRDETGKIVPNPGVPQEIAEKTEKYLNYREEFLNALIQDPTGFFAEHIAPAIEERVAQNFTQQIQQAIEIAGFSRWAQAVTPVLFQDGDPSKPLTPVGEKLTKLADQLIAQDKNLHPAHAIQIAWNTMQQLAPPPRQSKVPVPASFHAPTKTGAQLPEDSTEYLTQLLGTKKKDGTYYTLDEAFQQTVNAYKK